MTRCFNPGLTIRPIVTLVLLVLNLFVVAPGHSLAATYYIDQDHSQASDSNSGTEASPWLTISKAASTMVAGDTAIIKGSARAYNVGQSTNYEVPAVNPKNSGTAGNPITFRGQAQGANSVVIVTANTGFSGGNQNAAIGANSRSYITWDNITVRMLGVQMKGIAIFYSDHITVSNCTVEGQDITNEPVLPHNHDNHDGIRIEGSNAILVTDSVIKDVIVKPDWDNSTGIKMYAVTNVTIEQNLIFNNSAGIFDKDSGSSGTVIRRNLVHDNMWNLFTLQKPWQSPQVYENIFVNGNYVAYDTDAYSGSEQFYNNVIYFSQAHSDAAFVPRGGASPTTNLQFWNNIIYDGGRQIAHRCSPACVQINYHNYNGYYPKLDITVNEYGSNPKSYTTISAWRSAGWDLNGWMQDPKFVDPGKLDFHLLSDSPARGSGRNGEDIGAYPRADATVIGPRTLNTGPPAPPTGLVVR